MKEVIELRSLIQGKVFDNKILMYYLRKYKKPRDKILRLIHNKNIIPIKKKLTPLSFQKLFQDKINDLSIERAKDDILPFIHDKRKVSVWSKEFFLSLIPKISYC